MVVCNNDAASLDDHRTAPQGNLVPGQVMEYFCSSVGSLRASVWTLVRFAKRMRKTNFSSIAKEPFYPPGTARMMGTFSCY